MLCTGQHGGPRWPPRLAREVSDLLLACIQADPVKRPNMARVQHTLSTAQSKVPARQAGMLQHFGVYTKIIDCVNLCCQLSTVVQRFDVPLP